MEILETSLPDAVAREALQAEIRSGETIVWAGRASRVQITSAQWYNTFGGLFFVAFSIMWMCISNGKSTQKNDAIIATAMGCLFLLLGLWFAITPLRARYKARKNIYAITDQRALVLEGALFGGARQVYSFDPHRLGKIRRTQRTDGSGDLILEESISGLDHETGQAMIKVVGFIGINDVKQVEELLRTTLQLDETPVNS